MALTDAISLALLVVICVSAAVMDVRDRKLPNWLCAVALIVGLVIAFLSGGASLLGTGLLHAAIALVAGMALFAAKVVGGGDAKYYAALAAWFPLNQGLFLLVSVALSGLVLLIVWLIASRHSARRKEAGKDDPFAKLPYGVAISLGALVSFTLPIISN